MTVRIVLRTGLLLLAACAPAEVEEPLVGTDGAVDWNRYHTHAEANRLMHEFAARHPDLARVRTIGQSYLGADLTLIEITNTRTGPAEEKPALYLDGGIHARELTASQVALYVMAHLLNNHGFDAQVTRLLDTRTFYIRPKFNPDGSDLVLRDDQHLRSTVRPVDLNGDGVPDNDPPEDLDGDGRILEMRVPDANGGWRISETDARIMVRRAPGDTGPFYRMVREGVDRNGDGVINSDGIGGIDMNRNYPRNWGRWHEQPGAGAFPLSEPETHATARFIAEHRNIGQIVHGHTSGGFVYRLPSAMDPREFNRSDEALVLHLGERYTQTTGRPVRPSATHPTERRYGTLIQWAYSDFGVIGWVPEYSPGPQEWVTSAEGGGPVTEADWHRVNDEQFGGRYFTNWTPYDHPQLGPVEIGGWWTLFWGQNPPWEVLEQELEQQVPWILYLAEELPSLDLGRPQVQELGDGRFRVEVRVSNAGFLPTNLTEQGLGQYQPGRNDALDVISPAPLAVAEVTGGAVDGAARVRIPHLAGTSPYSPSVREREVTVGFDVRADAPDARVRITVASDKAGTVRTEWVDLREAGGGG